MSPTPRPTRITPLSPEERDERAAALVERFRVGPTVDIYATMARHPDVMEVCLPLGRRLRAGALTVRQRELVILRTGVHCDSRYELAQHAGVARTAGMGDEELLRIVDGPDAAGWDADEAVLLRLADELHTSSTVSDSTWEELTGRFDQHQVIEAIMLVGYYHMISYFLNATGVQVEDGTPDFPER
jgi:alkylhydroperoxidase family enzyme